MPKYKRLGDVFDEVVWRLTAELVAIVVMAALVWLVSQWWSGAMFLAIGLCLMVGLPLFVMAYARYQNQKENKK